MASGKYDLLVSLKSDVAQFKKNMNSARGSLRNFTQQAGPGMNMANTQASKLFSTFSAGRGVIGALVPTINSVQKALLASGIGAVLVGIGVAIAGVTAHINRTVEGSHRWKEIWSQVKNVGDVLGDRLADIGKGIKTMFRNFAEGDRIISGALVGVFKEIRQENQAVVDLQRRENDLWREKLDFTVEEAKLRSEISDLILASRDNTKSSTERQEILNKAYNLQNQLSEKKVSLAREELAIAQGRADLGHNSVKDEEELAQLQVTVLTVEKQRNDQIREIVNRIREAGNSLSESEKIQKKILEDAEKINQVYDKVAQTVKIVVDEQELYNMALADLPTPEDVDIEPPDLEEWRGIKGVFTDMNNILGLTQTGLFAVENAFAQLGETGKMSVKDLLSAVINSTGRMVQAYLAQAIASLIATESRKGLLGLITAGIGVSALMALWNTAVPQFAAGGLAYGPTVGMVGEYPGAKNNPEVIAPLSKLKGMIGGGTLRGELVGQGDTLKAVIEATEFKNKQFG